MMNRSIMTRIFLISLLALGACTSKRDPIFAQGQGSNLDSVQTWNEQFINIDTGDVIGTPATTNAQESVTISDKVKAMNHYDLVQIKVQNPKFKTLIGTPPFRGKPNTHGVYQAEIKLTENYLKIYKIAKKEDLPFEEHFYIEETLKDGRVAIPLVGYKVKGFYTVEPQKTGDDQDSHHLIEVEDQDPATATHVRIDWSSREVFEPIKNLDLFPAEIFFAQDEKTKDFKPYEWYYSETITEKSLNDKEDPDQDPNQDPDQEKKQKEEKAALASASKVVFLPREGEVRVVNVARDERLSRDQVHQSADLNSEATLVLPVKWKDYQTKAEGTNLSMKGEVVEERKWNQRRYFEADFLTLQSTAISDGKTSLIDIEVDQNYFSFTVKNTIGNKSRNIHYSFLRVDQGRTPYLAKISTQKDRRTFGFFTTVKPYIKNWEYYTNEDMQKREFMNRINPAQKEITFHLSSSSPKEFEDIAQMAVTAWDKTFEQALGKDKIHVTFSPDRVSLGDLRYNVIHLVDTLNEDGLLGYGPSIADPESGEIISATTNIYINSIQAIAANSVRQYMIDRLENRLSREDASSSRQAILTDSSSSLKNAVSSTTAKQTFALKALLKNTPRDTKAIQQALSTSKPDADLPDFSFNNRSCSYAEQTALSTNDRDIEKFCPDIEKIIDQNKNLSFTDTQSENNWEKVWASSKEAIRDCSKQITRGKLVSTLIHEMGHNFGLRHNFSGSYDKANFKEIKTIFGEKVIAHSSSIMEYTDWDEDRLTETGTYDVAAIRFGYGNAVEMKDGSIVDVGSDSIQAALSEKHFSAADLKPYLFCTDEDSFYHLNALCRTEDSGTTPKEIVQSYINSYKRTEAIRKYRRATPNTASNEKVGLYNYMMTFLPLREIYDEWRLKLADYTKRSNRYLTSYNEESYQQLLASMKVDPQFGPIYDQYYEASQLIYQFLKEIAFQHDEYCIVKDGNSSRAVEFVNIRDQLADATRGTMMIRSCAEAQSAADLAKILDANAPVILSQVGYPVSSYRFTKVNSIDDVSFDVLGNSETREYAMIAITNRIKNQRAILEDFAPSMLDEPTLLSDLTGTMMNRMIKGVDLRDAQVPEIQPLFTSEVGTISQDAVSFTLGLTVPGDKLSSLNNVPTMNRKFFFNVRSVVPGEDISKAAATLKLNGRPVYIAESKENGFAKALIDQYNRINSGLALKAASAEDVQGLTSGILSIVPANDAVALSLTLKEFAPIAQATLKLVEENSLFGCAATQEANLMQLYVASDALSSILADAQGKGDAAVEEILKNPISALMGAIQQKSVLFTAENLAGLGKTVQTCMETQNQTVQKYKRYSREYEAQKGMIFNILGTYAE